MKSISLQNIGKIQDKTYTLDEATDAVGFGCFQIKLLCIVGLGWAADAIETFLLSILGPILACEWVIEKWKLAVLTTGVFLGMAIGSPLFGNIADRFGRKKSLAISLVWTLVFSTLSAVSSSYYWMLVLRTCTGFGLGGLPQGLTLCSEFIPTNIRGKAGFYLCFFWSIGTFAVVFMAWLIMIYTDNWRLLILVAAIPTFLSVLSLKWLAESVRFLLVSDQVEEAEELVNKMAESNKKSLPPGNLRKIEKCENRGDLKELFTSSYLKTTLLFCYLTAASSFSYYGIAFISPYVVQDEVQTNNGSTGFQNYEDIMPCNKLTQSNYMDLLWTSAAELPGIFFFTVLIEKFSRKTFLGFTSLMSAILVFCLLLKINNKVIILLFLFGARGLLVAIFQLTYVMISESFPTTLRAVALGLGGSLAKLGGLLNSYVSQILMISSPTIAICIFGGAMLLSAIAAMLLPLETRGMNLEDTPSKRKNTEYS